MKYAYEDLSDEQFEELVVCLCQELLGIAVQGFTKGPDGGRDAKFLGTAYLYPSKSRPWSGTVIIQAKHTNGYNKNFSETDFFSPNSKSCILNEEIVRIKKLRSNNGLDHYMLFSNRKLAANAEHEIKKHISKECNLTESSICLCGIEQLEMWLNKFPDVPKQLDLDPIDSPLIVSPDDLSEVVSALAKQKTGAFHVPDDPPTPRLSYKEKNNINNMSVEYARSIRRLYLKETKDIYGFLSSPENQEAVKQYQDIVEEFQLKIIAKRKKHQNFDSVMNHLFDILFARDPVLRSNKRLTRAVLFYMYWNCDIGEIEHAEAD